MAFTSDGAPVGSLAFFAVVCLGIRALRHKKYSQMSSTSPGTVYLGLSLDGVASAT